MKITISGRIDHHHHVDGGADLAKAIHELRSTIMALSTDLKALTKAIDDATNVVATEITDLKSQIHNSMTDAEVADVKAGLQAQADRLSAIAADPANPVPVV